MLIGGCDGGSGRRGDGAIVVELLAMVGVVLMVIVAVVMISGG